MWWVPASWLQERCGSVFCSKQRVQTLIQGSIAGTRPFGPCLGDSTLSAKPLGQNWGPNTEACLLGPEPGMQPCKPTPRTHKQANHCNKVLGSFWASSFGARSCEQGPRQGPQARLPFGLGLEQSAPSRVVLSGLTQPWIYACGLCFETDRQTDR